MKTNRIIPEKIMNILNQITEKSRPLQIGRTVIITFCMAFIICAFVIFIGGVDVNSKISIQYKGSGKGLSPDGTLYDYNEIVSEDVLKIAYKKLGMPYDESAKSAFIVRPVMPENAIDNIISKNESGVKYSYFPNEFQIVINTGIKTTIGYFQAERLSQVICESYKEYFNEKYRYPFFDMDNITKNFNYANYDYPEMTKVFQNEYNLMLSYLNILIADDPEFVNSKGVTFQDIKDSVLLSKNIDLNKIDSIVSTYKLTKDKTKLINKYEFIIRRMSFEAGKVQGEYNISKQLIAILKKQQNNVILPSINGEMTTIKSLDKSYDAMAEKATEAKVSESNTQNDIAYYQQELAKLVESSFTKEQTKKAKDDAMKLADNLSGKMKIWMKEIDVAGKEYFDKKYNGAVTTVYKGSAQAKVGLKEFLVLFIGMLIISVYWKAVGKKIWERYVR